MQSGLEHQLRYLIAGLGICFFIFLGLRFMPLYALWDDEANTALFSQSVRETGDTSAIRGQNKIAYRNGAELNSELKARYVPPLQYFFLAPFLQVNETKPSPARAPFFWLSVLTLSLVYIRLIRLRLPLVLLVFFTTLNFGLTPFFLFSVQSRYYSLSLFFSVLLAEVYFFSDKTKFQNLLKLSLAGAFLFISNYLMGIAAVAALGVHALIYRRHSLKINVQRFLTLVLPYLLVTLPVFWIWNPLGKTVVQMKNTGLDDLKLLFRNFRDFNGGHLGSILILIFGLIVLRKSKESRFGQYTQILGVYLLVISIFSPEPMAATQLADIRYLLPLIFLAWAWMIDFGQILLFRSKPVFLIFAFIFSFCSLPYSGKFEFPLVRLLQELNSPAKDPYAVTSKWLIQNAKVGQTVKSSIDYAIYPLMYAAPQFHYLGQFKDETQVSSDFFIDFCGLGAAAPSGTEYIEVFTVTTACREAYRPEIFLRSFGQNETLGKVAILKKKASF